MQGFILTDPSACEEREDGWYFGQPFQAVEVPFFFLIARRGGHGSSKEGTSLQKGTVDEFQNLMTKDLSTGLNSGLV